MDTESKRGTMSGSMENIDKDLACARHGMYVAMRDAGLLVNGRFRVGGKISNKKKKANKKACRVKIDRRDF